MEFDVYRAGQLSELDGLLVLVGDDGDGLPTSLIGLGCDPAQRALTSGDFQGKLGDTLVVYLPDPHELWLVLAGIGNRSETDDQGLRQAVAAGMRAAGKLGVSSLGGWLPELTQLESADAVRVLYETAARVGYLFGECRSPKEVAKSRDGSYPKCFGVVVGSDEDLDERGVLLRARALSQGLASARDLANLPGNLARPRDLAKRIVALAETAGLSVDIVAPQKMEELGMGAFLGVAQGSDQPAQLVVMEHKPAGAAGPPIVLVGKGITFDSGGISLKQPQSMELMKYDKAGACAVVGTLLAAAHLDLPHHVVGLAALAENMPSGSAQRPGDIVQTMAGDSVEIISTDAEGRLVLADALAYACKEFKPRVLVDVATLTGACVVALGHEFGGLFTDSDTLARELLEAGSRSGELLWRLPLAKAFDEQLKSVHADVKNSGGRPGGACTAARFLSRFVDDHPAWAHLDMAGVAWVTDRRPVEAKGATGFGVGLLVDWLCGLGHRA